MLLRNAVTWACTNGTRADGPTLDHDGLELISRGASSQRIKSARTGSRRSSAGSSFLLARPASICSTIRGSATASGVRGQFRYEEVIR